MKEIDELIKKGIDIEEVESTLKEGRDTTTKTLDIDRTGTMKSSMRGTATEILQDIGIMVVTDNLIETQILVERSISFTLIIAERAIHITMKIKFHRQLLVQKLCQKYRSTIRFQTYPFTRSAHKEKSQNTIW